MFVCTFVDAYNPLGQLGDIISLDFVRPNDPFLALHRVHQLFLALQIDSAFL